MITKLARTIACALSLLPWIAGFASAEATLYHSEADDGSVPAAVPTLPTSGPEWIHLYVDADGMAATTSGSPCEDGNGDEICGFQISLQAGTGTEILDFIPAPTVYHSLAGGTLHANAIDPIAPGIAAMKVGDLLVRSTNAATGGTLEATGNVVVTAGLEQHAVAEGDIAIIPVPEVGLVAGLLSGLGFLRCVGRPRSRLSCQAPSA